jgi:hypothetical protein
MTIFSICEIKLTVHQSAIADYISNARVSHLARVLLNRKVNVALAASVMLGEGFETTRD